MSEGFKSSRNCVGDSVQCVGMKNSGRKAGGSQKMGRNRFYSKAESCRSFILIILFFYIHMFIFIHYCFVEEGESLHY